MNSIKTSAVELVALSILSPTGSGFNDFLDRLPNGRKVFTEGLADGGVPTSLGHILASGTGARTPFGADFKAAGSKWTTAFCTMDSDSDGQSNGFELGDEHCVWVLGGPEPCRTTELSDPGSDASTTVAAPLPREECPDAPTPPPGEEQEEAVVPTLLYKPLSTGPFLDVPLKDMSFQWKTVDTADGMAVEGTFNFTGDVWVAVGPNSDDQMNGLLIVCYVFPDGSGATCSDWQGDGWDFAARSTGSLTTVVSSVLGEGAGAVNQVTFRRPATDKDGKALGDIAWGKQSRTIWARGPVGEGARPLVHVGSDVQSSLVNFQSGVSTRYTAKPVRLFAGNFIIIALLVVAVVIVQVQHFGRIQVHLKIRTMFAIGWSVLLFVALILNVHFRVRTYTEIAWFAPLTRAMGDTAGLLLAGQLLSAGRRFFFQDLLSVSHERAMAYHAVMGILMVVATVWHAIGMWNVYLTRYSLTWISGGRVNPLAGVMAALCMIPVVFPALLRFKGSYKFFRLTHGFWVLVVIFSCLHSTCVLYLCLPGLANVVFGFLYGLYINRNARCEEMSRNAASGTVTVRVVREHSEWCATGKAKNIGVAPGSWFYLTVGQASRVIGHPFSVARCDLVLNSQTGKTEQHLQFIIKPADPKKKSNWTTQLYNAAAPTVQPLSFRADGPLGRIQLPLEHYKHIVLVSGGIGVTPNLFIMQHLAALAEECIANKRTVKWQTVRWIHANRDEHLLPVFASQLVKDVDTLRSCGVVVTVTNYITKKDAGANGPHEVEMSQRVLIVGSSAQPSSSWLATESVVHGQRPDLMKLMSEYAEQRAEGEAAAVYNCGPHRLIEESEKAAGASTGVYHVHSEVFEI